MVLKYFLMAWFTLGMVTTVSMVGKARKPITPGAAAIVCLLDLALIAAVVTWWPS